MDMKGNLGSFAAALKYKDVWVMNVVPEDGPKTLTIEYDRGLLGTIHNWYVIIYCYIPLLCGCHQFMFCFPLSFRIRGSKI